MRKYVLLAMLLAFAGIVGVAVAKSPPKKSASRTCAAVTTRFFKATNVRVTHISCVQAAGKIGGWIERGPKTIPLNAKKWHARRLGGGKWKVSFGKKGNPSVTFTLVGISSKPKPPPPPPPPPPPVTTTPPPLPPSPPVAPVVTSGPAARTNLTSATFVFNDTQPNLTFRCKLDNGLFTTCGVGTHVQSYDVQDGTHTFVVEAVNAAGLTADSAPYVWKVSTHGPPEPTLTADPTITPAIVNDGVVKQQGHEIMTFTFTDTQAGVTYLCALDGAPYSACSSPKSYDLGDSKAHTFTVEAVDDLGNVSAAGESTWTPDVTAPTISAGAPIKGLSYPAGTTVNANYSCKDDVSPLAQVSCAGTVASGKPIDTSSVNPKSFTVTAVDAAGNTSTMDLSYTVTANAPVVAITSPTAGQSFGWGGSGTASYTCTAGGTLTIKSCAALVGTTSVANNGTLPTTGAPGPGSRTLTVTAVDSIGQTTKVSVGYTVQPAGYYGLSFDDGPNTTYTKPILDELTAAHATATFFLIGSNVVANPALAQAEVAAGMQVGDHTWDHRALAADQPPDTTNPPVPWSTCTGQHRTAGECGLWQVEDTSDAIFDAVGIRPTLFRPPFGYYDTTTVSNFAALPSPYSGMSMTLWRADTNDWAGATTAQIVSTAMAVPAGGIILMHDAQQTTVDAVPQIITGMANQRGLLPGKIVNNPSLFTWHGPFCGDTGGQDQCPGTFQPDYHTGAIAP